MGLAIAELQSPFLTFVRDSQKEYSFWEILVLDKRGRR